MPTLLPTDKRQHLLLLPPPPSPPTYEALKAAYHASLFSVLTELAHSTNRPASVAAEVLDIALPCDHLYHARRNGTPRSVTFQRTHRLVAGLYKLICVISAKANLPLENEGGLDARLLLLAYPRNGKLDSPPDGLPETDSEGPVIDIATLALSGRPWRTIYYIESEAGRQILNKFRSIGRQTASFKQVRGGIVQVSDREEEDLTPPQGVSGEKKHYAVAVGGTFDHLHIGHKLLLTMTAFMMDDISSGGENPKRRLTIGVTGDELLKNKKFPELLESWSDRTKSADAFLKAIIDFSVDGGSRISAQERNNPGPNGHAVLVTLPSGLEIDYVEILDPFGPTITDPAISALVISAETRSGGNAVNSKRQENGWPPLEVFEVDVLDADDEVDIGTAPQQQDAQQAFQNKLSSTEIRRGLVEKKAPKSKA